LTIAAIYIRKSREDASKLAHRLTAQREQLPAHARAQGWQPEIYDDGHASAAKGKTEGLTQRARLEADIRQGKVHVILCIELSRLSRDDSMQDYVAWLYLCSEHNVKLATPSRILDPGQPSDWMLLLMEGGFSSVEMKIMQRRMAEGRLEATRAGRYLGGNPAPPYVYDKQISGLVVDETMNQKMQTLFQMALTCTIREMAFKLDMPVISVRRAISEDRLLFYQALRHDPVTNEIIKGEWPAILDAEQAYKILQARSLRPAGGPRRAAAGLLSNLNGLMVCGYCGINTRGLVNSYKRRDGTRLSYYACQAKDLGRTCIGARMIPQMIIDERVVINLIGTLERLDDLKQYWINSQSGDTIDQLETLERRDTHLKSQKKRLVTAVTEGVISFADAKEKRLEIEAGINQVATEIRALQMIAPEPVWDELTLSAEEFAALDFADQRDVITMAIKSIRIFATYLQIEYRFPRDSSGNTTARVHLPPKGRTDPRGHYKIKTT